WEEVAWTPAVQQPSKQRCAQGPHQPCQGEDTGGPRRAPVKAVPQRHIQHGYRVLQAALCDEIEEAQPENDPAIMPAMARLSCHGAAPSFHRRQSCSLASRAPSAMA